MKHLHSLNIWQIDTIVRIDIASINKQLNMPVLQDIINSR